MQIIRKPPKPLVITLIVLLSIVALAAAAYGGIYLYSEQVIFEHRDCSTAYAPVKYEYSEGYSINYPFFANPLALSGCDGTSYALIFGSGGEKNIPVYNAVNDPIYTWVNYLSSRYKRHVNLDYTMEQDSKAILVSLSGNVTDDEGKIIPLEQKFVFNIENASPENLPQWINKDEASADYKEYLDYLQSYPRDPENTKIPDWLARQIAEQ